MSHRPGRTQPARTWAMPISAPRRAAVTTVTSSPVSRPDSARYLGIDANLLRLAFIVLALAGGLGFVLYGAAWLLMAPAPDPEPAPRRAPDPVQAAALGAVVLGLLLLARASGAWFGDAIVWPLAAAALGLAMLWMQPLRGDDRAEPSWPALDRLPPAAAQAVVVLVGTKRAYAGRSARARRGWHRRPRRDIGIVVRAWRRARPRSS